MGTFLIGPEYAATPIQGIGYVIEPWPTRTITTVFQPAPQYGRRDEEEAEKRRTAEQVSQRAAEEKCWRARLVAAMQGTIVNGHPYVNWEQPECQHVRDDVRAAYHKNQCRWCYLGDPRLIDDPLARRDARALYGLLDPAWGLLKNDWREHHKAAMSWASYQRQHGLVSAEHWQWERRMLAGIYWSEEPTDYGPNLRAIFLMDVLRASTRSNGHAGNWIKGERLAHGVITRKGRLIGVPKQTAHDWYNGTDWDEVERLWDDYAAPRCDWPREPDMYGATWAAEDGATAWEDLSEYSDRSPA